MLQVDESVNSDHEDPRRIPDDILADLRRRNAGPVRSLADFKPANPDIVVRDLDKLFERPGGLLDANEEFEKRYPNAFCYVGAHLPGYSREGDSAIIVFEGGPRRRPWRELGLHALSEGEAMGSPVAASPCV